MRVIRDCKSDCGPHSNGTSQRRHSVPQKDDLDSEIEDRNDYKLEVDSEM